MSYPRGTIIRNTTAARINHWITAACFVLLLLSGLSMFHPLLFFLALLFGGGQWARAIHPWIGCVLLVSYAGLIVQFWRDNFWNRDDIAWMGAIVPRAAQRGGRRSRGRAVQRRAEVRVLVDGAARPGAVPHRPRDLGSLFRRGDQHRDAAGRGAHSQLRGDRGDHHLDHPRLCGDLGARLDARDDARLCDPRLGVAASPQMAARASWRPARRARVRGRAAEGS